MCNKPPNVSCQQSTAIYMCGYMRVHTYTSVNKIHIFTDSIDTRQRSELYFQRFVAPVNESV